MRGSSLLEKKKVLAYNTSQMVHNSSVDSLKVLFKVLAHLHQQKKRIKGKLQASGINRNLKLSLNEQIKKDDSSN